MGSHMKPERENHCGNHESYWNVVRKWPAVNLGVRMERKLSEVVTLHTRISKRHWIRIPWLLIFGTLSLWTFDGQRFLQSHYKPARRWFWIFMRVYRSCIRTASGSQERNTRIDIECVWISSKKIRWWRWYWRTELSKRRRKRKCM